MTSDRYKTKAIVTRDYNRALIQGLINTSNRFWTSDELAEKTNLTPRAVTLLLYDLEREQLVSRAGSSRGKGVRWGSYQPPEIRMIEFRPLKSLKSVVIPVRRHGRLAPDIYKDVFFVGMS